MVPGWRKGGVGGLGVGWGGAVRGLSTDTDYSEEGSFLLPSPLTPQGIGR